MALPALQAADHGPVLTLQEFRLFQRMIFETAGISLSDAKHHLVEGRLAKRLRQLSLPSFSTYFSRVRQEKEERQVCIDLLTTNETYFFREPKHFDFLMREVLPSLRQRPNIRVWSAACSSGEEPYTLAMVLAEQLGARPWEIVASDISHRVLETARRGLYTLDDASGVPHHLLHKYALKGVGDYAGCFVIHDKLKSHLQFKQVNLNTPLPALGEFDVIFLRNVMIYFNVETKRKVMQRLIPLLRPGGYFFVSHSESLNGITDTLRLVQPSVYQKPHA